MTKKLTIVAGIFIPFSLCALNVSNHGSVHSPAKGLEAATKRFSLQAESTHQTKAQVAQRLDRVVIDSAKNFETDRMTVALYLAKAGLPAATTWIKTQPKKAEELRQAINNQVNPEGTWLGHRPDWEIIKIALENGASYHTIHGFGSAIQGHLNRLRSLLHLIPEFIHLPQSND